jgi:hypothetical protein
MSDGAPASLTPAERVALAVAAETLQQTALTLRKEWNLFAVNHPDKATPEVHRGFLMAVHRIGHMAADIERNANG